MVCEALWEIGLQLRVLAVELCHLGAELLRGGARVQVRAHRADAQHEQQQQQRDRSETAGAMEAVAAGGAGAGRHGTASPSAPVLLPDATLPLVESATQRDREAIERQLGRPPRALAGVAARCSLGGPSVIAQRPYDEAGMPFPTTFWLSCRVLVRAVSELESSGGIAELEAELALRPGLRKSRRRADARVAALRAALDAGGPRADGGAPWDEPRRRCGRRAAEVPARTRRGRARRAALRVRPPRARAREGAGSGKLLRVGVSELSVLLAREDWRAGERFVERVLADPRRAPVVRSVMLELERELRRRLGQTYTLAQLVGSTRTPIAGGAPRPSVPLPRSAGSRTARSPTPPAHAPRAMHAIGRRAEHAAATAAAVRGRPTS